jgi:hypothetical protein
MPWTCSYCPIFCCEANEAPTRSDFDKAYLVAQFQVGGNKVTGDPKADPEYELIKGKERAAGELVWDPCHTRPTSRFSTVAPVTLEVTRAGARFSVGTCPFITLPGTGKGDEYRYINEIWVCAVVDAKQPQRLVQWDSIDFELIEEDGHHEELSSYCLPRGARLQEPRRAAIRPVVPEEQRPVAAQTGLFQLTGNPIVEFRLRAQVTLRANCVYGPAGMRADLGPRDLQGLILAFTDRVKPRQPKHCREG